MPAADPAVRLNRSPALLADVQTCIRAAEMRARHMPFVKIATELGLSSPVAAKKAVETGLALIPSEDVRTVRRMCADELHEMAAAAREDEENPGPLTSATGKVIIDPETDLPYPDIQARNQARRLRLDINKELRKLYGADAPKQSQHMLTVLSADEIRAEAARRNAAAEAAEVEALRVVPAEIEPPDAG